MAPVTKKSRRWANTMLSYEQFRINSRKAVRFIGKSLLWVIYLMLTAKQRDEYERSKEKGRDVTKSERGILSDTYTYGNHNAHQPKRNFLTWKEYRERHNF